MIGVVIPTTGKASLHLVLESLVRQDVQDFRTVVSFDGPSPMVEQIRLAFDSRLNLHVVEQATDRNSAAMTRNSGFRRCLDLDRVLVVDDDCLCPPSLVQAHRMFESLPLLAFGLRKHVSAESAGEWLTGAAMHELPETKPEMRQSAGTIEKLRKLSDAKNPDMHRYVYSCQASFPVRSLYLTGGMWEEMKGSGFEDVEFALRLHRAGCPGLFLPHRVVYHVDHPKCPRQTEEAGRNRSMYWMSLHTEIVKRNGGIWRVGDDFDDGPWARPRRH